MLEENRKEYSTMVVDPEHNNKPVMRIYATNMEDFSQSVICEIPLEDLDGIRGILSPKKDHKCKVCHNFNTIEWETDNPSVGEMQHMYDIVRGVHTIEETPAKPAEKPASEKQVNLLRQLGIPFKEPISSREAYNLIKGKLG